MPSSRKFILAVKTWGSDEAIHSWKYLKAHILQNSKDGGMWSDELVVVHISKGKTKEKEPWDQGGAVIAGMKTALQPYKHDVFDLEGDPGPLLVDIANKEQADIMVLATRGRNAMKKAMLGSMTDFVMQRANCACLVVKPQVGAGDTYRMKSAANPQGAGAGAALHAVPAAPRAQSPASSPMYGRITTLHGSTPFNRRVAIAYDTTASGRYLLKWASDTILEPTDNVFVVRAVPKLQMRKPGTSFADKNNVQRLAGDALQGMPHVTTFNLQQGNARKSVLTFASKESVDLLIIGMYKPNTRRKGLALRGNAVMVANRCACPCLVVPMSEAALQSCVKATDLELAAAEEEELASGSESDSDDDEANPGTPTAVAAGGAFGGAASAAVAGDGTEDHREGGAATPEQRAGSPEPGHLAALRGNSAAAIKQIRAPIEAFFKRRGSMSTSAAGGPSSSSADGAGDRRAALLAALQGGSSSGSSLHPGRYIVEVDSSGAVKSIKPSDKHHHHSSPLAPAAAAAEGGPAAAGLGTSEAAATVSPLRLTEPGCEPQAVDGADLAVAAAAGEAPGGGSSSGVQDVQQLKQLLAEREAELAALRQQLQQLTPTA